MAHLPSETLQPKAFQNINWIESDFVQTRLALHWMSGLFDEIFVSNKKRKTFLFRNVLFRDKRDNVEKLILLQMKKKTRLEAVCDAKWESNIFFWSRKINSRSFFIRSHIWHICRMYRLILETVKNVNETLCSEKTFLRLSL